MEYDFLSQKIEELKREGKSNITLTEIERLIIISKKINCKMDSIELSKLAMQHQRRLAELNDNNQLKIEYLKAVISLGQAALKSLFFIVGGATIAFIAFLNNNLRNFLECTQLASIYGYLWGALIAFGFATILSGSGYAIAYISQSYYLKEFEESLIKSYNNMQSNMQSGNDKSWGDVWRKVTIGICMMAYFITVVGIGLCAYALHIQMIYN